MSQAVTARPPQQLVSWPEPGITRVPLSVFSDPELYAWEHAKCFQGLPGLYINPGDLFEIRDLTLSIPVTRFVPRSNNAQLTLSSRNLAYWTKKELMVGHPEANAQSGNGISQITRNIAEQLPPSSTLVAVLRIVF